MTSSIGNTQTFVFDTITQKLFVRNIMLSPSRQGHKCVKVGSRIISIGGTDDTGNKCPMETLHVKHLIYDWAWKMIKDYILPRERIDQKNNEAALTTTKLSHREYNESKLDADATIKKFFTDVSLDTFRYV